MATIAWVFVLIGVTMAITVLIYRGANEYIYVPATLGLAVVTVYALCGPIIRYFGFYSYNTVFAMFLCGLATPTLMVYVAQGQRVANVTPRPTKMPEVLQRLRRGKRKTTGSAPVSDRRTPRVTLDMEAKSVWEM